MEVNASFSALGIGPLGNPLFATRYTEAERPQTPILGVPEDIVIQPFAILGAAPAILVPAVAVGAPPARALARDAVAVILAPFLASEIR